MTDSSPWKNPNHRRFLAGKIIQRVHRVEQIFGEAGFLQESNMASIKDGCFLDDVPMNENHYESLLITIYHYYNIY